MPKHPYGLAAGPAGSLYVIDVGRDEVLQRLAMGRFRIIAGDGERGLSGDGGRAVDAKLRLEINSGIVVAPGGALYIADSGNHRVREVRPDGTITTVAGGGESDLGIGTTRARNARFGAGEPTGLTIGPNGALFVGAAGVYRLSGGFLHWVVGTSMTPAANWHGVYSNPGVQYDFDPAVRLAFDGRGDLLVAGGGGFGLYERTAEDRLRYVESFRGDGEWGSLAAMPDGDVLLTARSGLSIFHPSGTITVMHANLNPALSSSSVSAPNTFIGGDGVAVGGNGAIYLDTNTGNSFTSVSALLALRAMHPNPAALWRS